MVSYYETVIAFSNGDEWYVNARAGIVFSLLALFFNYYSKRVQLPI